MTVGREALIEGLVGAVVAAVGSRTDRFHGLIGARGMGKSHVLRALTARLRRSRELLDAVIVPPRPRCPTSLVSLLAGLLGALPDDPVLGPAADAVDALRREPGDREERALDLIRARLGARALVVILDDLDELLAALGSSGQQRFEEILRAELGWVIVASARATAEPFPELFATHPLPHLTPEQCQEMLARLAEAHAMTELAAALTTARGAARVRGIHHVLGGNPRALRLAFRQLDVARLDRFELALLGLAHELEPRLRERMDRLSPGQRGLMEALAESWGPLTVTELAEQTFSRQASVSGALRHLRREGLVRALELGRERYYELGEPLHRLARPRRELLDCAAVIRRWYADATLPLAAREPAPAAQAPDGEYDEARAMLGQSPRIALGRLRGRLASRRSPVMQAALVLALERNGQVSEAMDALCSVARARARSTHEALVALAAETLGDPQASPAAGMVERVLRAHAEAADAGARAALLDAFDAATPTGARALSDMLLAYPILDAWLAADAHADLGALLHRLRPGSRSEELDLALERAIVQAWHRGRLPELLGARVSLDSVLAVASARTRELLAYASAVADDDLCADELEAELRRRLGRGPTQSAWPSAEAIAAFDSARAALMLQLLSREAAVEAWLATASPSERVDACEALIAAGKYAWIASGRTLEPLAALQQRVRPGARVDAAFEARSPREAFARLSAIERALVRAILERQGDTEALAGLPRESAELR